MRRLDPSEDQIHELVADWLRLAYPPGNKLGVAWYSVEHRNAKSKKEGWERGKRGVKAGIPDIHLYHCERAYLIEMKSKIGYLSNDQKDMHKELRNAGVRVGVARSLDHVIDVLLMWQIPVPISLIPG